LKLKDEFPALKGMVYMDCAAMAPPPASTIKAVSDYTRDLVAQMSGERKWEFNVEGWGKPKEEAKKSFAKVIGATYEEIAYMPNATTGINTVFNMLPIKKGQNIVTTDLAFPMGAVVVEAQRRRGAKPRVIRNKKARVEMADFEKAVDDKTAVVYIDHAAWFNGYLFPLKEIAALAHDHGAKLVVDATQSMGSTVWNADKSGVDFAGTSTYKWLLGGLHSMSCGFLYIKKEHVDAFQPSYAGGSSMEKKELPGKGRYASYEWSPAKGAGKFEVFRGADVSYVAVGNSMKVLLDHGIGEIEKETRRIGTRITEGLLDAKFKLQSAVEPEKRAFINIKHKAPEEVVKKMAAEKINVSARIGGIRVSPYFFNTDADVDVFLKAIRRHGK
jgi:selenocysteine lyase/cysteine desulfurase